MTGMRILCFVVPALALLAAACSDEHPTTNTSPYGMPGVSNTAPNVNNPDATDPMDPEMNPHDMRKEK
ncbi:MAG TPA: hypothetical protein VGB82_06770 [Alphaproteobacteria bacterium]